MSRVLTRWAAVGMAVLVAAALCIGCGKRKSNPVVFTVDGQNITAADVLRLCPTSTRNQAVLEALERALVEREAAKLGIKVTDDEVQQIIEANKKAVGGEEEYRAYLAQSHLTIADVADAVRMSLLQQKIVTRDVVMTESEVRAWYNKYPDNFGKPAQAQFWALQTKTLEQAQAAIRKVKEGAEFQAVAESDSSEQIMDYTRPPDWGWLPPPGQDPESDAIHKAKPGEMTQPVEVKYGPEGETRYRVYYIIDKKPASLPAFEEVKLKAEMFAKGADERAEDPNQLIPRLVLDHAITVPDPEYAAIDQVIASFKQRRTGPGPEGIPIPQGTPLPGEGEGGTSPAAPEAGSSGGDEAGGAAEGTS